MVVPLLGPPRIPTPSFALVIHLWSYFWKVGLFESTRLRSRKPFVSLMPGQPSVQRVFVTVSISTGVLVLSIWVGTVPLTKTSRTVWVVYWPGRMPLLASTVAQVTPSGCWKSATGVSAVTSCMNACQIGAAISSDMTLWPGALSLLPAHTPATIAGAVGSAGGAT